MNLTLITLDNGRLRVDAPYHPEIVARCKECGGEWDKAARVWWIDAGRGDRLLALLPKASYDYDALGVCFAAQDARGGHFAASMAYLGIALAIDESGAVCATGEAISPLLRDEIAKRADALRPWVGRLPVRVSHEPVVEVRSSTPEPEAPDEEERRLGLWLTGVKNAAKRAEEEARRAAARRPRRKAAKQEALFNG